MGSTWARGQRIRRLGLHLELSWSWGKLNSEQYNDNNGNNNKPTAAREQTPWRCSSHTNHNIPATCFHSFHRDSLNTYYALGTEARPGDSMIKKTRPMIHILMGQSAASPHTPPQPCHFGPTGLWTVWATIQAPMSLSLLLLALLQKHPLMSHPSVDKKVKICVP